MQTETSTPQVGKEKLEVAPVLNPGQNLISFEEAMAAMNGGKFLTEEETFLAEEELSTGGSSFTPNLNPNRVVTIKSPKDYKTGGDNDSGLMLVAEDSDNQKSKDNDPVHTVITSHHLWCGAAP